MKDVGAAKVFGVALISALVAPIAAAQSLDGARAFTAHLYQAYQGGAPDYLGRDARRTFTTRLLAQIRRDRAATPSGDVGILDGDPICDCQDAGGVRLTRLIVKAQGPGRARADVTLRFPAETRSLSLDLVAGKHGWRVADVHTRDTPSLAALLESGLQPSSRLPR